MKRHTKKKTDSNTTSGIPEYAICIISRYLKVFSKIFFSFPKSCNKGKDKNYLPICISALSVKFDDPRTCWSPGSAIFLSVSKKEPRVGR